MSEKIHLENNIFQPSSQSLLRGTNLVSHMTDATFLDIIQHTQDFSTLTIAQAVKILGPNNGTTTGTA